jgi:hypothetical protein
MNDLTEKPTEPIKASLEPSQEVPQKTDLTDIASPTRDIKESTEKSIPEIEVSCQNYLEI